MPEALNEFGFRVLRTLADGASDNVMVSPLSVSLALAMTYNGAAGGTQTAMAETLGLASLDDEAINRGNRDLVAAIAKADPAVEIAIANALWLQAGFTINPAFIGLTRDFYGATANSVDFSTDPQAAANAINEWVNKNTKGRIPTIINRPDPSTRLILTDAVYFKGRWKRPFDPKKTHPREFHLTSGASAEAPMMDQAGKYPYFETDAFQAIRLVYGNGNYSMYLMLPRDPKGLPDLVKSLSGQRWNEWKAKFAQREGRIVLPKFESKWGRQLNAMLKTMGMAVAFDPERADFSRINTPPPRLFIDDVEHKTWIKVDEEGTEAAAATSVGMALALAQKPEPPFEMIVDHPFFLAIAEQQSGAILFTGMVTDPTRH